MRATRARACAGGRGNHSDSGVPVGRRAAAGAARMPDTAAAVDWQPLPLNFSTPFSVKAGNGRLWIRAEWEEQDNDWRELKLKGANWAGFQTGTGCIHELWRHPNVTTYVDFLSEHHFNAVRLPLSAAILTWALNGHRWKDNPHAQSYEGPGMPYRPTRSCGMYNGMLSLDILDDVIRRLRDAGIFVMLDLHTLELDGNPGMWCDGPCDEAGEQLINDAWGVLASRYCSFPNVILADVFNEPWASSWTDWASFVGRIGARILEQCPRWLVVAQGVAGDGWCWGENHLGYQSVPIPLPADRLVLSVHVFAPPPLQVGAQLIANGCNVNLQEGAGSHSQKWTALHMACYRKHIEFARMLLAAGADPSIHDINGNPAKAIAEKSGNKELVALLAEKAAGGAQRKKA